MCDWNLVIFWFVVNPGEYMSLPASQYSVLDAERIERVDDSTFRCYVYRFKFFAFEICPVLLVRVEEQPNGCCIKLLSCKVVSTTGVFLDFYFFLFLISICIYFCFSTKNWFHGDFSLRVHRL